MYIIVVRNIGADDSPDVWRSKDKPSQARLDALKDLVPDPDIMVYKVMDLPRLPK